MTFRRPKKLPFESTMAFSKIFTVLPKTGGTLKTFLTIHFFVDLIPLVYFFECSSSAVSMTRTSGPRSLTIFRVQEPIMAKFFGLRTEHKEFSLPTAQAYPWGLESCFSDVRDLFMPKF